MATSTFFRPATRQKVRLRMAIDGPSGSGKTFTALRAATALAGDRGRIAIINTESGAVEKYLGLSPDGTPWQFDVAYLPDFSPTTYTQAILAAGREGYDVLIVDSLSHAWAGEGGALELKDKKGGNSFTAWKDITPMHNRLIEAILKSPCHVIATMRSKTEYILEEEVGTDGRKKSVPKKVGMAPVQRAGMEYEFDIYVSMDWTHTATVTKSRCPEVADQVSVKPGSGFFEPVIRWLNDGGEVPEGFYTASEEDLARAEAARIAAEKAAAKEAKAAERATKKSAKEVMAEKAKKTQSQQTWPGENGSRIAIPQPPTGDDNGAGNSPEPDPDPNAAHPKFCTPVQKGQIEAYFELLGVPPDARAAALKKRGANAIRNLTWEAAEELAIKLYERALNCGKKVDPPAKEEKQEANNEPPFDSQQ